MLPYIIIFIIGLTLSYITVEQFRLGRKVKRLRFDLDIMDGVKSVSTTFTAIGLKSLHSIAEKQNKRIIELEQAPNEFVKKTEFHGVKAGLNSDLHQLQKRYNELQNAHNDWTKYVDIQITAIRHELNRHAETHTHTVPGPGQDLPQDGPLMEASR